MSLYNVVQEGDLKELRKLIDVEEINRTYGNSLLHVASFCNHPHIVQYLLENGADPFQKNIQGKLSEELTKNPEILALLKIYRKKYLQQQREEECERQRDLDKTPPLDLDNEFKKYEFKSPSKANKSVSNLDFVVNEREKTKDKYYTLMDEKIRESIHLQLDNERIVEENVSLRKEIELLKRNMRDVSRMRTDYVVQKNELLQSKMTLSKTRSENRSLVNETRISRNELENFRKRYDNLEKSFVDLKNKTLNESRNLNRTLDLNSEKIQRTEKENDQVKKAYRKLRKKYDLVCSQYCVNDD